MDVLRGYSFGEIFAFIGQSVVLVLLVHPSLLVPGLTEDGVIDGLSCVGSFLFDLQFESGRFSSKGDHFSVCLVHEVFRMTAALHKDCNHQTVGVV